MLLFVIIGGSMNPIEKPSQDQSSALTLPVVRELLTHADCGSRLREAEDIRAFIAKEGLNEEEAYELITAVGSLDPEEHPFSNVQAILNQGIDAKMAPTVIKAISELSASSNLKEEHLGVALKIYMELVANGGELETADIEFRIHEMLGASVDEETVTALLNAADKMMGQGRLCYPESLADMSRGMIDSAANDYDEDEE